jgi:hypothetical protein
MKTIATSIYGSAIIMSTLLKIMDFNLHSVPYDIAMTMFEFSKGLLKVSRNSINDNEDS